jgi:outer membrane protein TolC
MKHTLIAGLLMVLTGCQVINGSAGLASVLFGCADQEPLVVDLRARLLPPSDTPELPPGQIVDLQSALVRAGIDNPTIALAVEAIRASEAQEVQAQALLLPTLNAGGSFNWHEGNLLTSQGIILNDRRESAYAGAGAGAVGAGTVAFPGVFLTAPICDALYEPLVARYQVTGRQFDAQATRNHVLLDVATAYFALAGAQARLAAQHQSEEDFAEIARLAANWAKAGQGRESDANRAATDTLLQHAAVEALEGEVEVAAAELARLLNADPAVPLRAASAKFLPLELVDRREGLDQLIQVALLNRPEIAARSADVTALETRWRKEIVKPLLPTVAVGFSAGGFGGGGNLATTNFGDFRGRTDFDVTAFWSLQNFGFGNLALQHRLRAEVGEATAERARVFDAVRSEVAEAFAQVAARRQQMDVGLRRLKTAQLAYEQDMIRARNLAGRPIEILDSARQLSEARQQYLQSLIGFNQAQMQLFVSLGQPPAY